MLMSSLQKKKLHFSNLRFFDPPGDSIQNWLLFRGQT